MAHRSRAHIVIDSERQNLHRRQRDFERSVERSRALHGQAEERAMAAVSDDGDIPTSTLEAQIGKPLHSSEIIKRLRSLNANLTFEVALADSRFMGVYFKGKHQFGMESGYSPEFSVLHRDDEGHFYKETRGWRTILARLIRTRLITEPQANKVFGAPSRSSQKWSQAVN